MWENELIMLRFGFYLLIVIVILLLVILWRLQSNHERLVEVLRSLAIHSCDKEREGDER